MNLGGEQRTFRLIYRQHQIWFIVHQIILPSLKLQHRTSISSLPYTRKIKTMIQDTGLIWLATVSDKSLSGTSVIYTKTRIWPCETENWVSGTIHDEHILLLEYILPHYECQHNICQIPKQNLHKPKIASIGLKVKTLEL